MSKKKFDTVTGKEIKIQDEWNKKHSTNLKAVAEKLHQEDIKNGYSYNKQKVDDAASIQSVSYSGADKYYADLDEGFFDPYEDYIDKGALRGGQLSINDLNLKRAQNQSTAEQIGHGVSQFGRNIIPNIIAGYASMFDIQGYWDAEHAANNSIVKWADEWQKNTQEYYPIYRENPDTPMDIGDPAWWASNGAGLVTSITSFMAQGAGVGKAVSIGLKGIGTGLKGKNLARTVLGSTAEKTLRGATGADRSKRLLGATKTITTSVMLNQSEAVLEATQVYQDTYDNILEKTGDFAEAKRAAAKAASTTIGINRINILLNLSSAKAFLRPQSFTKQLLKEPSLMKSLGLTAIEGGQEAVEELINLAASKAGMAKGEGKKYTFEDALNDMGTMEGFEAAFLGAIGGIGQTGGTKLMERTGAIKSTKDEDGNRMTYTQDQRNKYDKQQEIIEELKSQGVNITDAMKSVKDTVLHIEKLKAAAAKGDSATEEALINEMFEMQAMKAFSSGTTEILEELYKEEAAKDPEEVGQEHIDRAKQALKDLKVLESVYVNHEDFANKTDLYLNRANKIRLDKGLSEAESIEIANSNELSKSIKIIASQYNVTRDRDLIYKKEGEEERRETITETVPLSYNTHDLENSPETTPENKAVYDKFLAEVQQLPQYHNDIKNKEQVDTIRKAVIELDKEYKNLTSKEVQKKVATENAKKAVVKEATTSLIKLESIADIEKLKQKVNDEAFSKLADEKIIKIKNDQKLASKEKKRQGEAAVISSKIKNATTPEEYSALRTEIVESKLPKKYKDELDLELDKRISGEDVEEGEFQSLFTATSPEEEEATKAKDAAEETNFPKDVPNSNTETEKVDFDTKQSENETAKDESKTTVDENNQLVYSYDRSTEGHNRAAYLSRYFEQLSEMGVVSREESTDELLESSKQLLDPDKFLEGTPLVMEVDYEYEGDTYDSDSDTKGTKTWAEKEAEIKQLAIERRIADYRDTEEYINQVPIKVSSEEGEFLFYVHEAAWIQSENIDNGTDEITADRKKLITIRKTIIDNGKINKKTKSKIKYKSYGKLFKTADGQRIDVSDAMPDSNLVFAIGKDGGLKYSIPESQLRGGKKGVTIPFDPKAGVLYAIVPIGPNKSIPVALHRKSLDNTVKKSILKVVELYLEGDTENQIVKDILEQSEGKIDITDIEGLRKYLNQFIYLISTDEKVGLAPFVQDTVGKFDEVVGLITVTANSIEFGRPGVNHGQGTKVGTLTKNWKKSRKEGLQSLSNVLDFMLSNTNLEMLQTPTSRAILINESDEVTNSTYTDFIKTAYETNFISANIGTEESPKWVYTIQPTILFDTTFAGIKPEVKKATNKPSKSEVTTSIKQNRKKKAAGAKNAKPAVVQQTSEPESKKEESDQSTIKDEVVKEETTSLEEQEAIDIAEEWSTENLIVMEAGMTEALDLGIPYGEIQIEDIPVYLTNIRRALEIREERSKQNVTKFEWGDGITVVSNKNIKDDLDENTEENNDALDDDDQDYFIPEITKEQNDEIQKSLVDSVIIGVDEANQHAAIEYLSSTILKRSLKQKETTGNGTIDTKPLFDEFLIQLQKLKQFHVSNGHVNKANKTQALINQYSKVKKRVNEHLSLLKLTDNEEQGGLSKTVYNDDWSFTISGKDQSSIDLKKFFSAIANREPNGDNKFSSLGILEMVNYDTVYNEVQRLLANVPADFDTMIQILELKTDTFPWINSVIEQLKNASDKIKNEFVSNMTKHSLEMQFIMWSKDKDGNYSLHNWSSNSSSIQKKLLSMWQSNLKGLNTQSNLVISNDDGDYIFNTEVANTLITQAKEWEKDSSKVTNAELAAWLGTFGIVLTDETYNELREGNYRNGSRKIVWSELFKDASGFVQVLSRELNMVKTATLEDSSNFTNQSAIKNLAKLDANNVVSTFSNSFNAGNKTVYSYTNNNYLVNRMNDLIRRNGDGSFVNQDLINNLKTISFTKESKWLKDLTTDDETLATAMRSHFGVSYMSLEALKKMSTESKDNRKLNNLVAAEHEMTKLGMFFSGSKFRDGELNIRRKVSFFYPTMSDKTTMMLMQALSQELKLNNDGSLSDKNLESLYSSTVLPEINRMMAKQTNKVTGYEPNNFYFFHGLNNLIIDFNGVDKTVKELIQDGNVFDPIVKTAIKNYLNLEVTELVNDKLKDWKKLGIGITNASTKEKFSFLDKSYMSGKGGKDAIAQGKNNDEKVRYAATDFIFNSLVANAEMHMLFIGDPALYAKMSTNEKFVKVYNEANPGSEITVDTMTDEHRALKLEIDLEATFVNIGKRLAGDIAPGIELADSQNNKYHQVFFEDTKIDSNNLNDSIQKEYFEKIIPSYGKNYKDIEGSDAQEYTTWKEHLYVMKQMGRLTTQQHDKITEKLISQSKNGVRDNNKLSYDELGMILQPMKPVYVGNQLSLEENVDRRLYIKSSSFPLIPELTVGMGIDSVRKALETFETENNTTVRASFGTANKVGAVNDAITVFNKDGSTKKDIKITESNSLQLDRKNFRIQQDVPYNREKDAVNIGTQARKLLFVNLLDVEIEDGVTGEQLKAEYDQYYEELFQDAQEKLKVKLGLVDGQSTIPAIKLKEILEKEVKTRQGYPSNMLEALELNDTFTDFKIPLWASPFASKFESLLTSIVSNKVIKQKFPGHSYVLGSEEGFRLLEGDAVNAEINKSGVVFSDKFDHSTGLQPMRWDPVAKKMLPAQIMVPFKFRDDNGNILDIKQFTKVDESGRTILDTEKIPEKVLQLFGFRIPTQERNSMSAVEIVGFLPESSGDLLLAPRDWTKQMGSDFDVDKLYTYSYNTYFKDGKLYTDFLSNKEEIEKQIEEKRKELQLLKKELRLSIEDSKLFDEYLNKKIEDERFNENGEEIVSSFNDLLSKLIEGSLQTEIETILNEISVLNRSYKASKQNAILDIHMKVMTSTNPEIVSSIMALDSFGDFEELAADIQAIRKEKGLIHQHSTILSDAYQRMKYINATAGKNGVGSFSLDSSFNAVVQGKELVIDNLNKEVKQSLLKEDDLTYSQILANNEEIVKFGDIASFGDLSNKYTLLSQQIIDTAKAEGRSLTDKEKAELKTKSTIIRTLQSAAVDNEKAQLLDKLNINDETFDAVRAMALLGFEEKEIAGLLTQEIIWEYIEELSNSRSSLTAFVKDADEEIFINLKKKYDTNDSLSTLTPDKLELLTSQSGNQLISNIKSPRSLTIPQGKEASSEYNLQQLMILTKFRKLTQIGKDIKKVQSAINSEAKGAPNSLIETTIKVEQIDTIGISTIFNTENLLGEYSAIDGLVKPTTINGQAAFYGVKFANVIFDKYFPYKQDGVLKVFDEVRMHLPLNSDIGTTKKAELHGDIFKGIKSYLLSTSKSGLFTDNVNTERARLFIDSPTNQSLATILTEVADESWFISNGFLNKLMVDRNTNGEISRVNFEAAAGENLDERNIYQGFIDLLASDKSIGKRNGYEYTRKMLAQDLIMAAFLEGSNQGAKQYLKYVPVAYLKGMGFGDHLASVKFDFSDTFKGINFEFNPVYTSPSNMTIQYFQNNPQKARSIELHQLIGKDSEGKYSKNSKPLTKLEDSFKINSAELRNFMVSYIDQGGNPVSSPTHFLSIYDSKLSDNYALYEYSTSKNEYQRIEVAKKAFGFTQYNLDGNVIPVGKRNSKTPAKTVAVVEQKHPGYTHTSVQVTPTKTFDNNTVNNSTPTDTFKTLPIDIGLSGTDLAVDDLFNALEDGEGITEYNKLLLQALRDANIAEDLTVKYIKDSEKGLGSYNATTNTVTYNISKIQDLTVNDLANVFIHELSHVGTSRAIKAYSTKVGRAKLSSNTIQAIENLEALRQKYIKHLKETGQGQDFKNYNNYYWSWKYDQITPESKRTDEGRRKYLKLNDVSEDSTSFAKDDDRGKFYGALKLEEFVAMALTDPDFQQHLNEVTDEDGTPWWTSFVELLNKLLNTLGFDVKNNSLLASAIDNSMELIRENKPELYTVTKPTTEAKEFVDGNQNNLNQKNTDTNNRMKSSEDDLLFINAVEEYNKICKR